MCSLLLGFSSYGQTIVNAATADEFIAYSTDVENTGLFLNYCDPCQNGFAAALCWDGTEPGVAFTDGAITTVYALPQGAHDPDIILNQETNKARVVYEQGLDIHQIDYELDPTTLTAITITGPTPIIENAEHPNIDLNTNQIAAFVCKSLIPLGPLGESIPIYIGDIMAPVMTHMITRINGFPIYAENFGNPNITGPCLRPDVAIGSNNSITETFWIYPTFDEEDPSGNFEWWTNSFEGRSTTLEGEDPSDYFPIKNETHAFYVNPSAGRIAAPAFASEDYTHVATHSANTLASQQVDVYFGQSTVFTAVDWFNPDPYSAINPAIDWVADPYVNIAWTAEDKVYTDAQDIIVAQHDHVGAPYFPGDWSRANIITPLQQHIVSISGLEGGIVAPAYDVFGYCWIDNNRFVRYKYNAATVQALKRDGHENTASISPNPAQYKLLIQGAQNEALESIMIYDLFGRRVSEKNSKENALELNIAHWPAGVYFVVINNGQPQRFIKH